MIADDSVEIKVLSIISPSIESMGYEIVRVRMQGSGDARALQIMVDRKDGKMIVIEDCEKVSKHVSAVLDVEDPIPEAYNLEVSSPGVDRPLTRLKDFEKFAGFEVKIDTKNKIAGQAKFRGNLIGVEGDEVLLGLNIVDLANPEKPKQVRLAFDDIRNAKLVLTNELMKYFEKQLKKELKEAGGESLEEEVRKPKKGKKKTDLEVKD